MNRITYNTTNFQGRGISKAERQFIQRKASTILNQDIQDIVAISNKASEKRMYFLDTLVEKYNQFNFYRKPDEMENPNFVKTIFENIKQPKRIHYDILERFADSFSEVAKIFEISKDDTKSMEFAKRIKDEILKQDKNSSKTLIPQLLNSPFIKTYIKKYSDIKPFLILNKDDSNAVEKLDKLFATKNYDKVLYQLKLNENNIKDEFTFNGTATLNKDVYFDVYNLYTKDFMNTLKDTVNLSDEMLRNGADKSILQSLKTLTKNNIEIRQKLLKTFSNAFYDMNTESKNQKLASLTRIFERMDNDKHTKNFIKKSYPNITQSLTPQELEEILNNIPTKKLDIFRKNAWNVILQTDKSDRIAQLKDNIENPFFKSKRFLVREKEEKTYGYRKSQSLIKNAFVWIENSLNILRDRLTPANDIKTAIAEEIKPLREQYVKPEITVSQKDNNVDKNQKQLTAESVLTVIAKKLGVATFSRQNSFYTKNATKIRLAMLPEIFASVADTRKADRAVGKRKINSANKDVLKLYLKINGNNKKFVNYLLKKRNVDNTRMFEIADIIAILDKAEAKITQEKKLNPAYRAKDTRKYYNHLYEAKIEQYGKIKPQRKIKTNA